MGRSCMAFHRILLLQERAMGVTIGEPVQLFFAASRANPRIPR